MLVTENKIHAFLKSKGQLEDIDSTLITELLFNIELAEKCKEDMRINGFVLNVTVRKNGKPYYVKSQFFIAYNQCLRNINNILTELACTPRERQKFKLMITESDQFDDLMGK